MPAMRPIDVLRAQQEMNPERKVPNLERYGKDPQQDEAAEARHRKRCAEMERQCKEDDTRAKDPKDSKQHVRGTKRRHNSARDQPLILNFPSITSDDALFGVDNKYDFYDINDIKEDRVILQQKYKRWFSAQKIASIDEGKAAMKHRTQFCRIKERWERMAGRTSTLGMENTVSQPSPGCLVFPTEREDVELFGPSSDLDFLEIDQIDDDRSIITQKYKRLFRTQKAAAIEWHSIALRTREQFRVIKARWGEDVQIIKETSKSCKSQAKTTPVIVQHKSKEIAPVPPPQPVPPPSVQKPHIGHRQQYQPPVFRPFVGDPFLTQMPQPFPERLYTPWHMLASQPPPPPLITAEESARRKAERDAMFQSALEQVNPQYRQYQPRNQ